jgi:phenylalanyl-tRNA synthetase beta chain
MKVSLNWLKDFVDVKISPKVLAKKLTMAGLEVGSIEEHGKDAIFEMEITANRPDCLSILGIAQEVAAITGQKLKPLKARSRKSHSKKSRQSAIRLKPGYIKIEDKKDCAFYRGCLITDVKIGQSPEWLRNRIESVGIRPVNNVVDITNCCLMEYGQPLHAFDYNKIVEKIIVRRARKGEKILTIDGTERELSENIMVISDKNRAVAIAGIMGDKLSEVGSPTKNILLESAYFNPILIRRGSRELGLSSESSYRFERQVDFERVLLAQNRAIELICEIANGKFIDEKQDGALSKPKEKKIAFDCQKVGQILAMDVKLTEATKIFNSLGFSCGKGKGQLLVSIPQLRRDIQIEEDLIEEFARVYGYENMPSTFPSIRSAAIDNYAPEKLKQQVRETLCAYGFNEAINFSLLSKDLIDASGVDTESIKLKNPLSNEQEFLRPSLLPGLLHCLAYNLNHKNLNLKLFELGHVFGSDYSESMSLGLIAVGRNIENWQHKQDVDFFALKGCVQNLLDVLGFENVKIELLEGNRIFSGNEAAKIICQGKEVGIMGKVDKSILLNFDIKNAPSVFYAEVSLEEICSCQRKTKKFAPLAVFPGITRDLSLAVGSSIHYEDIVDVIKKESGDYLKSIKLIDTYKGEQVARGSTGLTISLELCLQERTLTDEEASGIQQKIVASLKKDLGVQIR